MKDKEKTGSFAKLLQEEFAFSVSAFFTPITALAAAVQKEWKRSDTLDVNDNEPR